MKKYSIILFVIIVFTSCKKFLDKDPTNEKPEETAYQKYGDVEAGLNGCYKRMLAEGYYGKNLILYPEVASDNMKLNLARTTGSFQTAYLFTLSLGSAEPDLLWKACYDVINSANRIIKALPGITDGTDVEKAGALSEALAIRALAHFDLVRAFAQPYAFTADASHPGVPIITENNTNLTPARNTVAEVYTQIINDLDQANLNIGEGRNPPFTFSRYSVQALMSRVYLYKKDWENASKYATAVISSSDYSTLIKKDLYSVIWSLEYDRKEDLFVLGFTNFDYMTTRSLGYELLETGYGDIVATNDIYDLFETGDIRESLISNSSGSKYCNKYPGRNYTIGLDNIRAIRTSEMYLTAAEAMAEMTGKEDSARFFLNELRSARFDSATVIAASGDDLKTAIQNERRRELAFEGHRLFDLTRRGKGVTRVDVIPGSPTSIPYPGERLIMPIPQHEMDANSSMVQNPGY